MAPIGKLSYICLQSEAYRISLGFFEYVKLDEEYIPTYEQVKALASKYLGEDEFNWDNFRSFVNDADKDKIAPTDFNALPFKLEGDSAKESVLIDRVMILLPPFVDKDAVDQEQMKKDLTSVVQGLDAFWDGQESTSTDKGVIERHHVTEYRALVGAASDKPGYIRVDVATVSIDARYKKETHPIIPPKITKDGNFSVKVINLIVAKGFTA
ncbi:hypothetical protein AX16_007734 [Volvariella volvacea WC 439]|nr:hypothetical protein AX16_007734 [Volvariella volvacea WC 439]